MDTSCPIWKIRDKRRFLVAAIEELAGDAHISFEGDLRALKLADLPGASTDETASLKRNTLWPRQDFVVSPLEVGSAECILRAIGGTVPKTVPHIQVEKAGKLEMGLYDSFQPEMSYFGTAMIALFHTRLEAEGIVREWTADEHND